MIKDEGGNWITNKDGVEKEVIGFYKRLLGESTRRLPAINLTIMKGGPVLTRKHQLELTKQFTREEVYKALQGIEDSKAPGDDGLNAYFSRSLGR